jgi:SAM-dependent methyltransferase
MKGLELGPGGSPLKGFVGVDVVKRPGVVVADVSKRLPFDDGSFDVVYASHVLEHMPWYDNVKILKEWARMLRRGGKMEVWVPNALKICEALIRHERNPKLTSRIPDKWARRNPEHDPCVWANGRTFYGDSGAGSAREASFHKSMYSPRYLQKVMTQAGLKHVSLLVKPRGVDHGWINLGMEGTKP